MLGQRRRRWTNIKTTSAQCLVFAGYPAVARIRDYMQMQTTVINYFFSKLLQLFAFALRNIITQVGEGLAFHLVAALLLHTFSRRVMSFERGRP